ncbi:hypothetical protein BDN72DRAFT_679684 [Pluteus cervinus]|uniref:Uncharacterized protein n=1 Tax=Pluteus cervinus TaxID=181527 RepID=A0ACD3AT20_9AGAR|nr:hypothetical protein BDN72DRAFT_679684 [Pluteus cervinus]
MVQTSMGVRPKVQTLRIVYLAEGFELRARVRFPPSHDDNINSDGEMILGFRMAQHHTQQFLFQVLRTLDLAHLSYLEIDGFAEGISLWPVFDSLPELGEVRVDLRPQSIVDHLWYESRVEVAQDASTAIPFPALRTLDLRNSMTPIHLKRLEQALAVRSHFPIPLRKLIICGSAVPEDIRGALQSVVQELIL